MSDQGVIEAALDRTSIHLATLVRHVQQLEAEVMAMSDTESNAVTVHPTGEITVNRSFEARYQDCTIEVMQLEDRIAELERRESLLTEVVRVCDRETQVGGVTHHYGTLLDRYRTARAALDWLPPEPSYAGYALVSGWPVEPVVTND